MQQSFNELIEYYNKKIELLNKVFAITQRQQQYIEKDEIESLIRATENCHKHLRDIAQLNGAIDRLKSSLNVKHKVAAGYSHIKQMEEEITRISDGIESMNNQNNLAAQKKLEEYKQHVAEARNTKRGVEVYSTLYGGNNSIFFDAKK